MYAFAAYNRQLTAQEIADRSAIVVAQNLDPDNDNVWGDFDLDVDGDGIDDQFPSGTDSTVQFNEDDDYTLTTADFGFSDQTDNFLSVTFTNVPAGLLLDGVQVSSNVSILVTDIEQNKLTFEPATDSTTDTSLFFTVTDDANQTSGQSYTLTLDIQPQPDKPTANTTNVTVTEDVSKVLTSSEFATHFNDVDGDTLAGIEVITMPSTGSLTYEGNAFGVNSTIGVGNLDQNKLVYTPIADDMNGSSFTFKVIDSTNDKSDNAYTLTLNIVPQPDNPTANNESVLVTEDTAFTLLGSAFDTNFADVDLNSFAGIEIVTQPSVGGLTFDGATFNDGEQISLADLTLNKLVYTRKQTTKQAAALPLKSWMTRVLTAIWLTH